MAQPTGPFDGIIPRPLHVEVGTGTLALGDLVAVTVDPGAPAADAAASIAALVGAGRGGDRDLPVLPAGAAPGAAVALIAAGADAELGDEGYEVAVAPDGVRVVAGTGAGFAWAVQTLRQLLPPGSTDGSLPVGTIRDRPRFAWRGLMLDVVRHFRPVDDVCHVVDLLAAYKLNRLHLHLTDDQGWRLAIRSHPALTEVGGRSEVGGGPGGWYSQDDYRLIVAHAQRLGVVVVPEVDVPGHTNAALHAMPALGGDRPPPGPRTDTEVGYSSLDVDAEVTYAWLDDVVREVAELTPGPYLHIGGDESHATDPQGYERFVTRALGIVRAHGKVPVGWEEIGRAALGGPAIVQHWFDPARVRPGHEQGASVIASPANRCYLDMKTDATTSIGLDWAGFVDARRAYEWDPARQVPGLPGDRLLGVEAPLWTETVTTRAEVEQMLLPRLAALAEVGWTDQGLRSFDHLAERLRAHRARWEAAGWAWTADPSIAW